MITPIQRKNQESQIIWDVIYACEAQAAINNWNEDQKAAFIKAKMPPKSKKYAYYSLKRIASSGNIKAYADSIARNLLL